MNTYVLLRLTDLILLTILTICYDREEALSNLDFSSLFFVNEISNPENTVWTNEFILAKRPWCLCLSLEKCYISQNEHRRGQKFLVPDYPLIGWGFLISRRINVEASKTSNQMIRFNPFRFFSVRKCSFICPEKATDSLLLTVTLYSLMWRHLFPKFKITNSSLVLVLFH